LAQELGVEDANANELYDALDWLLARQGRIERKLAKRHLEAGAVVLFSGADGCDLIRRLVAGAPAHLTPGGTLLVEIGEEQGDTVRALAAERFASVTIHPDLAGRARVLEAR